MKKFELVAIFNYCIVFNCCITIEILFSRASDALLNYYGDWIFLIFGCIITGGVIECIEY